MLLPLLAAVLVHACGSGGGRPPRGEAARGAPGPTATAAETLDSTAGSGAPDSVRAPSSLGDSAGIGAQDSLPAAWTSGDSAKGRAVEPAGSTTAAFGDSAAPARGVSIVSDPARAAAPADTASVFPASTARRIPLLPWPFYGRRSLARLGPRGVAALPAGSPEHRLLDLLDFAECAGRPRRSVATCYFLEGGRVYAVRREAGTAPPFRLTPLDVPRGGSPGAGAAYVDTSAPDGPVLVVPPGVEITLLESAP